MNLPEENVWQDGVYKLETTDPVLGGDLPGGISNQQAKQLADRTVYLKDRIGRVESIDPYGIGADTTFTADQIFNKHLFLSCQSTSTTGGYNVTFNCAGLPDGAIIRISAGSTGSFYGNNRWLKLSFVNDVGFIGFNGGNMAGNTIWLYSGETLTVAYQASGGCYVIDLRGNFDRVGETVFKFKQPLNSIIAQGQLVNRADYPRLWFWLNSAPGGSLVTDDNWLVNGFKYTGCFSTGNGTTTFRLPDLRGMFIRGLDLGRGVDVSRLANVDGGYEADDNKQHNHTSTFKTAQVVAVPDGTAGTLVKVPFIGNSIYTELVNTSSNSGSAESRPKNVAYTPYILL